MPAITEDDLYQAYIRFYDENSDENEEPEWKTFDGADIIRWSNRVVEYGLFTVKNGDPVHWLGQGYRNTNLMFWNAKENTFIWPYTEVDDYGSVPPCFLVGNADDEFLPDHWIYSVDHNSIVFVSDEIRDAINHNLENHCIVSKTSPQQFNRTSHVHIKGVRYCVEIHQEIINPIEDNVFHFFESDENGPTLYHS
jgi:hypothetical protein